jgi:hypothetical protein
MVLFPATETPSLVTLQRIRTCRAPYFTTSICRDQHRRPNTGHVSRMHHAVYFAIRDQTSHNQHSNLPLKLTSLRAIKNRNGAGNEMIFPSAARLGMSVGNGNLFRRRPCDESIPGARGFSIVMHLESARPIS